MNLVILNGNLCKDWSARQTPSGKMVISSSIAVKVGDNAEFINLQAWEKTAELLAEYIKKGDRFTVVGRLKTNKYSRSGVDHYFTYVAISSFYFGYKPKSFSSDGIMEASEKETSEAADLFGI